MPTIRRLTGGDWRTVRRIRLQALGESPEAFSSTFEEEDGRPDEWWVSGMEKLAWFVADEEGEPVGVVAGMHGPECPEVISMWVDPRHRRSGVAGMLLAAVVDWAEQEGADTICLAVAEGNEAARRFYDRAGFEATGPGEPLRSRPAACTVEMRRAIGRR